jgi:hypothetical protein
MTRSGSRSSPTSAGPIFGLLAADGTAGADLLAPSGRLTVSVVPATKASHREGYRAWGRGH